VVFIQLRTKNVDVVDDRTGNGDDVGREGIEDGRGHDGHGRVSTQRRRSTVARVRKRRPDIFFERCRTSTHSSQTQTTRAQIIEASASLRVTGDLGWARMCQNEEVNAFFDKEARYRCLRELLCFGRCDMNLHNRRIQTALAWDSDGSGVRHSRTQTTRPIWQQAKPRWTDHRPAGWTGGLVPARVSPTSQLAAADFFHLFSIH